MWGNLKKLKWGVQAVCEEDYPQGQPSSETYWLERLCCPCPWRSDWTKFWVTRSELRNGSVWAGTEFDDILRSLPTWVVWESLCQSFFLIHSYSSLYSINIFSSFPKYFTSTGFVYLVLISVFSLSALWSLFCSTNFGLLVVYCLVWFWVGGGFWVLVDKTLVFIFLFLSKFYQISYSAKIFSCVLTLSNTYYIVFKMDKYIWSSFIGILELCDSSMGKQNVCSCSVVTGVFILRAPVAAASLIESGESLHCYWLS